MASKSVLIAIAMMATVVAPALAADYMIDWTLGVDYQAWVMGKEFHVRDTLMFMYTKGTHNVKKVNGTGFQQCAASATDMTLTTGNDVITLATPGKKWYICGVANHCTNGMKLVINVLPTESMAPAPAPSTPTSAASGIVLSKYFAPMIVAFGVFLMTLV